MWKTLNQAQTWKQILCALFNSWLYTSTLLQCPSILLQVHRIWDRESKLLYISDLTIQPHWVNWGIPATSHTAPKANRASSTCRAKGAAQLSSELSRSLSKQVAEQAAEQACLDFPLYCNHIYCKMNSLQQSPLFRKDALWVERSQHPTSSILRLVSGDKECNQGCWSTVTTFQSKCWQWQSPIKLIPNTEKKKNWPKSLSARYPCCHMQNTAAGSIPTRSPLKNNHTLLDQPYVSCE